MLGKKDLLAFAIFIIIAFLASVAVFLLTTPRKPEPLSEATFAVTNTAVTQSLVSTAAAEMPASPVNLTAELASTVPTTTSQRPLATTSAMDALDAAPTALQAQAEPGLDLGNGLLLVTMEVESQEPPSITLRISAPQLVEGTLDQMAPFNRAVDALVVRATNDLRQAVEEIEVAEGGNLWISYTVPYMSERLLSVRMEVSSYVLFTVHPSGYFYAINYDRQTGEVLALGDLFQPGSDYLGVLSRYCLSDLEKQGVLYWDDGAQPKSENYERNWNFTPWGLLITFDEYEVAPYAAGAQTVIIPFAELQGIAEPNGPLRTFTP